MDLCEDENHIYVKIIDYKSGSTSFDLAALYYGLQLQLVVYMDAAMELMESKNPEKEIVPAGIFYYHIDDPVVDGEEADTKEDADRPALKKLRMDGLVNSEPEVISLMDREIEKASDMIPVADEERPDPRTQILRGQPKKICSPQKLCEKIPKTGRPEDSERKDGGGPLKAGKQNRLRLLPLPQRLRLDRKLPGYEYRRIKKRTTQESGTKLRKKKKRRRDKWPLHGHRNRST